MTAGALLDVRPARHASRSAVSVVIPCYNYARYLAASVDSVLNQPDVDVSVLIIDDASTDSSADVAERLARRDSRVEFRVHERNRGHIATYNEGLEWADKPYSVLLSADDLLAPGALARATSILDSHPDVGLVYGRAPAFSGSEPAADAHPGLINLWSGEAWLETRCRLGTTAVLSPEVVVRTELQHLVGGYRADLPHSGDHEMWLRFAAHAGVAYIDADHAFYRVHSSNMSQAYFGSEVTDLRHRKAAFDAARVYWQRQKLDADRLHAYAMQTLAEEILWSMSRAYERGRVAGLPAGELLAFAREACPSMSSLPAYRRFARRRRLGTRVSAAMAPVFIPSLVSHRVRHKRLRYGSLWWRHLR